MDAFASVRSPLRGYEGIGNWPFQGLRCAPPLATIGRPSGASRPANWALSWRQSSFRGLGQNIRLDLVGVRQLVHGIEQPDDREHLPERLVVESELLHRGRVRVDAVVAAVGR